MSGNTVNVSGTIPYEDEDAALGLEAGNRLSVRFINSSINSSASLPSGTICTIIGDTVTNSYTKDAFESDGSLILVCNVSNNPVTVKITWESGVESVYTINLSSAILESNEE